MYNNSFIANLDLYQYQHKFQGQDIYANLIFVYSKTIQLYNLLSYLEKIISLNDKITMLSNLKPSCDNFI